MGARFISLILILGVAISEHNKHEFCGQLTACLGDVVKVCGIRQEGEGFKLRLFDNECELHKYGCRVADNMTYEKINLEYCIETFSPEIKNNKSQIVVKDNSEDPCKKIICYYKTDTKTVCGIKQDGNGFKIRMFINKCHLDRFNCENNVEFLETDHYICNGVGITTLNKQETDGTYDNLMEHDQVNHKSKGKYQLTHKISLKNNDVTDSLSKPKLMDDIPSEYSHINGKLDNNEVSISPTENNEFNDDFTEGNKVKDYPTDVNDDNRTENNAMNDNIPTDNKELKENSTDSYESNQNPIRIKQENNFIGNKTFNATKIIIVVDGPLSSPGHDVNESIDNFFAATHMTGLPLKRIDENEFQNTRRQVHIKLAGPSVVFKPWHEIPENITHDYYHEPTLQSCFHKCPMICPDIYSPVCGSPGNNPVRHPAIMFKNHCLMDVAQCKVRWENKGIHALSANYIEASFLFCLGVEMERLNRFLPFLKTLQHMGRLKKKGRFHYIMKNMKFFNMLSAGNLRIQG